MGKYCYFRHELKRAADLSFKSSIFPKISEDNFHVLSNIENVKKDVLKSIFSEFLDEIPK